MTNKIKGLNLGTINKRHQKNPFQQKNKAIASSKSQIAESWPRTTGVLVNMTMPKSDIHPNIPGKKIRTMRGVIVDAYKETPDTWTLSIFISDHDKDYIAGQFISISPHQFLELKDLIAHFEFHKGKKEVVRAYSLTSAPHEKYLSITIKPEGFIPAQGSYPPLLSPLLASDLLVGKEIEFIGYAGAYIMTDELRSNTNHAIHLVAGSGIVPSFSIIKDELLAKQSAIKHTVLFVNKTKEDIIFHDELRKLERNHQDRFQVHYFLTKQKPCDHAGKNYYFGRPSLELIRGLIKDKNRTVFFGCGPAITKYQKRQAALKNEEPTPRFMEWVHDVLEKLDIDKKRIKREVYG